MSSDVLGVPLRAIRRRTFASLVQMVVVLAMMLPSAGGAGRSFTVRDSIVMRRITSLQGANRVGPSDPVRLFSPDGRRFVIRTRRGDIDRDENVDQLLLWNTADVNDLLSSGDERAPPVPRLVTEQRFHNDSMSMSGVQWVDDNEIGFIARGTGGKRQVFLANVETGELTQVTHSTTDLVSFAAAEGRVVYFATHPQVSNAMVVSLPGHAIADFLAIGTDDLVSDPIEMFVSSSSVDAGMRIEAPAVKLLDNRIWVSPDGRYAVTLTPAINAPSYWSEYRVWDNVNRGWTKTWVTADPAAFELADRSRYQLVDLQLGKVHPLFDAPDGTLSFSRTPHAIFWLGDGRHVVVTHTYLPLQGVDSREHNRRAAGPAIAEVDLKSGIARAIVWEPFATFAEQKSGVRSESIVSVRWDPKGRVLGLTRELKDRSRVDEFYERRGQSWSRRPARPTDSQDDSLIIDRKESTTQRPELFATGGACHCSRLLFDPAPEADELNFGHQETLRWKDSKGRDWKGGLVYPVGYKVGERYPLIIQTHGYSEGEFLIDGPSGTTTAYAAQPLAGVGFMVLQVGEIGAAITDDDQEGKNVVDGWRAVIEKLSGLGLIDPNRVGIIGWSRTGYHLAIMLATYPSMIAAATIADSVQYDYSQYLFSIGNKLITTDDVKVTGGEPISIGYGKWFEQNEFYRFARAKTPLRVEALGPASLLSMWETYAVYTRAGKPADFVYFPEGAHVLLKPSERLGSQGGDVDWFRFWLQGYEDPDPMKRDRYRYWRDLRNARH